MKRKEMGQKVVKKSQTNLHTKKQVDAYMRGVCCCESTAASLTRSSAGMKALAKRIMAPWSVEVSALRPAAINAVRKEGSVGCLAALGDLPSG